MEKLGRGRGGGVAAGIVQNVQEWKGVQYKAVQPVVIVTGGCRGCRGWGVGGKGVQLMCRHCLLVPVILDL